MKYEAKVAGGVVNSGYNGHNYLAGEVTVSNATDVPIVNVDQTKAIAACQSIGAHLITNNEWMTLARNVEQVTSNWSGNAVGNGYLYSGHSDNAPAFALSASTDDTDGYNGTSNTSPSNQRRTLTLSNGNVIWDLAGNVWEHVNKANTIDGSGYASGQSAFVSATPKTCPWGGDGNCFELNTASGGNIPLSTVLPL